jgi:2-polyprenyl-6-methoxyphenol hydroxylase-like FAD-dependent oxidoreductase
MNANETEVLIVGAGPAGLMMACQLAIQGIRFRIIDKKEQPTTHSGALIIQARSIEIFDQMGIAQKFINEGIIANHINILFNGKQLNKLSIKNIGSGLSKFPYLLLVKQAKTEEILTDFINVRGYYIERGIELLNLYQDLNGVTSLLKNLDGSIESIKTPYLIAADGGKSIIRQQLHIPFIGKVHNKSLFIIDCKTDLKSSEDDIFISVTNNSISGFFPMSDGKWRIDGTISKELKQKETLTFDDVEEHFSERTRMDTTLYNPEWFSVFHSHQHHAATFQKERCFLIGDAAHIHSPVGAQGMNTGLQDAFNLSWKLAFVLKGKADQALLDTFTSERLPVAKNTAQTTDHIFNLLASETVFNKTFRRYFFPFIIKTLSPVIERENLISRYLFKSVSQTGIHYRESILSRKPSINFLPSQSLRPGDRLPFIRFNEKGNEVNFQEKVKATVFHLFIFSRNLPSEYHIKKLERYRNALTFEIILQTEFNKKKFKSLGIKKKGFLLVRPDLYIAFQTEALNFKQLENYLSHFLYN